MNDTSLVAASLSRRAHVAAARARTSQGEALADPWAATPVDPALTASLRHHLRAGETHYPARPGMVELRERIAARLGDLGLPHRGADSVVVTASEGESLFVTLLGLDLFPGGTLVGSPGDRHQALLDWMDITVVESPAAARQGTTAYVRRVGTGVPSRPASTLSIVVLGAALFRDDPPLDDAAEILVGSLDGIDGMAPFGLGFVAGEPASVQRITKWKQACSICSPAPSQRAALFALGVRP